MLAGAVVCGALGGTVVAGVGTGATTRAASGAGTGVTTRAASGAGTGDHSAPAYRRDHPGRLRRDHPGRLRRPLLREPR